MLQRANDPMSCPLMHAVSCFSGKWKPFIIWYLGNAPGQTLRFGRLWDALPYRISHKMLIQHLRELEQDGIVRRHEYWDEANRCVDYALTQAGKSLAAIMYLLRDWGALYGDFDEDALLRSAGRPNGEAIIYRPSPKDDAFEPDTIVWNRHAPAARSIEERVDVQRVSA